MKRTQLLPLAVFIALWQLFCSAEIVPAFILPSPLAVGVGLRDLVVSGMPPGHHLSLHVLYSLERVFVGVLLAVVLGVPLGLALGGSKRFRAAVLPLVDFFRPIPPLAWIPLAILWFGIGLGSAGFIIFLGAFFPIVINTCAGVREGDTSLVDAMVMLNATRLDVWLKVLLPGALPSIFTGIRIGVGIGWMTLVAAEFTGVRQGYGLGYMIMSARDLQRMDEVLAGMAVIGVLGLMIEWCLGRLSMRLLRWK